MDSLLIVVGQKETVTVAVPFGAMTAGVGPLTIVKSAAFAPPIVPVPGVHATFPVFVIVITKVLQVSIGTAAAGAPVALATTPAPALTSLGGVGAGPPVIVTLP